MSKYLGDVTLNTVLHFSFNTRDSIGNPITLAGSPVVSIYKQGSTSACNVAPTLTVSYNSQTGLHRVIVDTSVATSPTGFYAAGNDYFAIITTGTVNGVSVVGAEVAQFSIQNRTEASVLSGMATHTDATTIEAAITALGSPLQASAYTTPPTVSAIQSGLATHTDATTIEAAITALGSPLQASAYTTPPTVSAIQSGLATHTDATSIEATLATIEGLVGGSGGTITVSAFSDSALLAMRNNLNGVVVTVNGPVFNVGGLLVMVLTAGDDYSSNDSRQITVTLDGTVLPTLVGATVELCLSTPGSRVVVAGSATVPTGSSRTVVFQPTASQTALLVPSPAGKFAVKIVTAGGTVITPAEARGTLNVLSPIAP